MFILCSVFIIRFSESFYLLSVVFLPVLALVKGLMKHGLFCPFFFFGHDAEATVHNP